VTSEASPQNTNFSQTYTYDALNRLTSSTRGDGLANQTWGLDGVGNMATVTMTGSTAQSRTVNAANEIAASSGIVTPLYDAAGNTIYGPSALQGQQTTPVHCVYDAWNRLVAVYADNRSGGLGAEIAGYQYDGLNRRVKKSLFDSSGNPTGGDQYYYNQNGQVIEDDSVDTNGVAQSIDQYVWGPGSAGAPLVCLHDGNADGDPTNDDYYTDWRRYYLTDANGNVTTMIRFGADPVFGSDEIAYVTRVVYTAYGTATEMGEDWTGAGVEYAFDGPLYCGYWHDTETGLSQTQNRYYNPNLSTWINRDPFGDGANLYAYCGDSPTDSTDPSGQFVRFANMGDANAFVKEVGLTNASVVQGTGYIIVLAPPRERAKVFTWADKRFSQVFKLAPGAVYMDNANKAWVQVATRRNLFIQNSGVIPNLGNAAVDIEGNAAGPASKEDLAKISETLKEWAKGDRLAIDVGGEGLHSGAINVNIQPMTSTTGKAGRPIPLFFARVGTEAPLVFSNRTVKSIFIENTPISEATANEVARVIAAEGIILLDNPEPYATDAHARVLQALRALGRESSTSRKQYEFGPGVQSLRTTIFVQK
ncbi:MAG: RHS repeat-associated core domain-containing protein, partial [Thermoguttaceae bacterium]